MQLLTPLLRQLETGDVVLGLVLFLLLGSAALVPLRRLVHSPVQRQALDRYLRVAWQIGALLGLEQAYEFTRGQIPLNTDLALLNAYRLLDFEWRYGFFIEQRVERFFLQITPVMNAIDVFYLFSHVAVTIGVMVWLYGWRQEHFPTVRNLLMVTTAIALVVFYVYPTAPPRLVGYGFVDPAQIHHLVGEGGAQPGSYTYNPYAAMPSLHVGYAIISAIGVMLAARRSWLRILAGIYPFVMAAAVIISGNHWVLDVVGAFVTVGLAWFLLQAAGALRSRLQRSGKASEIQLAGS